jgi:hypothetical protein
VKLPYRERNPQIIFFLPQPGERRYNTAEMVPWGDPATSTRKLLIMGKKIEKTLVDSVKAQASKLAKVPPILAKAAVRAVTVTPAKPVLAKATPVKKAPAVKVEVKAAKPVAEKPVTVKAAVAKAVTPKAAKPAAPKAPRAKTAPAPAQHATPAEIPAKPAAIPTAAPKAKPAPTSAPATPKAAPAAAPKAASAAPPVAAPTFEQIQTQAYFVAERRHALGLPGDAASDWIQAEKELLEASK